MQKELASYLLWFFLNYSSNLHRILTEKLNSAKTNKMISDSHTRNRTTKFESSIYTYKHTSEVW